MSSYQRSTMDLETWMQDVSKNKLTQLILPGSSFHGSDNMASLLKIGVRYFHLEIEQAGTGEYHCHGIYVDDLIRAVDVFCRHHPTEIVLLELDVDPSVTIGPLLGDIIGRIKYSLIPPGRLDDTIDALRKDRKQVVVFSPYLTGDTRKYICPSYFIHNSKQGESPVMFLRNSKPAEGIFCNLRWIRESSLLHSLVLTLCCQRPHDYNREFDGFMERNGNLVMRKAKIVTFKKISITETSLLIQLNTGLIRPYIGEVPGYILLGAEAL